MTLVIGSSRIHRRGCYTTRRICRGTRVVEYTGRRLTIEEGDQRYEGQEVTYLFGLQDGKHVIDGRGIARYINHSCNPNCTTEEVEGKIWIVAVRDILPGEELSYDYLLYDGEGDAPCRCGAPNCRGSLYSPQQLRLRKRAAACAARKSAKPRKRF